MKAARPARRPRKAAGARRVTQGRVVKGKDGKDQVAEGDVVEKISELLKDKENKNFRKLVADRFNEFILYDPNKQGAQGYIAQDQQRLIPRFKPLSAVWISTSLPPNADHSHDVAVLYFVMGDKNVPEAMVKAEPALRLLNEDCDDRTHMDKDGISMASRLETNMKMFRRGLQG